MSQSLPLAAGCTHCPALVANRRCIVHGYGDLQARMMIIGEAPGVLGADRTGVPFTGDRSGRRLQKLLIGLELSREDDPTVERPRLQDVFLTNVVRCNPPGNRNPTAQEVANCTSYLAREIEQIRPRVLVALGSFAVHWAFGHLLGERPPSGVRALHGRVWPVGDAALLSLVHPVRASNRQMEIAAQSMARLLAMSSQVVS